jgi:hypothetical protein
VYSDSLPDDIPINPSTLHFTISGEFDHDCVGIYCASCLSPCIDPIEALRKLGAYDQLLQTNPEAFI